MTQAVVSSSYTIQMSDDMLALLQETARQEGRQVHAILDEALRVYFDTRQQHGPRQHVAAALRGSIQDFDALYAKLSK